MPSCSPAAAGTEAPRPQVPRQVDVTRVLRTVQGLGLRHFVDDEGDVGIPWRYVTVHVVFQDTRAVQLRGAWHRVASIEFLKELRAFVEEWNLSKIGPKAYVTVCDSGTVRLHGEVTLPLEGGLSDAQLEEFILTGCRLVVALMSSAEEVFPDPLHGAPEAR